MSGESTALRVMKRQHRQGIENLNDAIRSLETEIRKAKRASAKRIREREPRAVEKRRDPGPSKSEQRQAIRALCVEREGGHCAIPGCNGDILHMDHFWGRAREESVESCWMLCADHDRQKTLNRPSRRAWIKVFEGHCVSHGYDEQVTKCLNAAALERAQHPGTPDAR